MAIRTSGEGDGTGRELPDEDRIVCWICQQPLRPDYSDLWRGEPIHRNCR